METVKGVLIILVILLSGISFILFLQYSTTSSQLESAKVQSGLTLELLRIQAVKCDAIATQFSQLSECLEPLLMQKDFKQDAFAQPDDKKGTTGYLIIKNINRKSYNASLFTFQYNRVLVQEGCTIPGTIEYNVVCRFNFDNRCEKGDVLEVFYPAEMKETKVFTETC